MRYESESVSLYALIQWGLKEHTERQLAALPSQTLELKREESRQVIPLVRRIQAVFLIFRLLL